MAVGKNKGAKGKKGGRKAKVDPFTKKVWYEVRAPTVFDVRRVGRTLVTKTAGQKIETDGLKGRICEFNLADMMNTKDHQSDGFKKIKLCVEEIQGKNCLTDLYGMSLTRDKVCTLIKKRQSLIEAYQDVKTTDGFVVRVFCIAFTNKAKGQQKATCYAQTAQIRKIRRKMCEVMDAEVKTGGMKECFKKLTQSTIEMEIEKATRRIFPLQNIHILKVKIVKKPKIDIVRLFEMHDKSDSDSGVPVQKDEDEGAENLLTGAAKATEEKAE